LNSRLWILFGIIICFLAFSSVYIYSSSNILEITIQTNGSDVTVLSPSWFNVPDQMKRDIKEKTLNDIYDPQSNVDSLKIDANAIAQKYDFNNTDVKIVSQYGIDELPMIAVVRGTSMNPTLKDGQEIIALKTRDIRVGDIIIAFHPDYGLIVKRLVKIENNKVYLKSDNRNVEVVDSQIYVNGEEVKIEKIEKTPLDTWLPKENVIGVVKVY
jgi:signal peptidase I